MISLILSVCLALPEAPTTAGPLVSPTASSSCANATDAGVCRASNARLNNASTPLLGGPGAYQRVPVIPHGGKSGDFHVAYSARSSSGSAPCQNRVSNSMIAVFQLSAADPSGADILIFGTGYGNRRLANGGCNGAQYMEKGAFTDASNVNAIVRDCLGLSGTVKVEVIVPHAHADHINPEFLHELEAMDYAVQAIMTHADEYGATLYVDRSLPTHDASTGLWGQLKPLIQPFGSKAVAPCLQTVCTSSLQESPLSYLTVNGPVWMRERGGHTQGAVDLVLDAGGNTKRRFVLYGSTPPGRAGDNPRCMPPTCDTSLSGVLVNFKAHGNLRYL